MATKKTIWQKVEKELRLFWSKRGGLAGILGALIAMEELSPGTLAKYLGDAWAVKALPIIGLYVMWTKRVDSKAAE